MEGRKDWMRPQKRVEIGTKPQGKVYQNSGFRLCALGFKLWFWALGLKSWIQQNACIQQFVYGLGNGSGGTQDINVPEVVKI